MVRFANAELILELSEMLVGKQVDTNVVAEALKAICHFYAFDAALIYEIDQTNYFNIKEHFCPRPLHVREHFSIEEINPMLRKTMSKETVTYHQKAKSGRLGQAAFLALFSAEALIALSIVDEKFRTCAFIIFVYTDKHDTFSTEELNKMSVALHLLGRYISIRSYQNKLDFTRTSLESILDNTGIDIYVNDFDNHDILYVNKSMAAPYGGVSHFVGKKCWEVLFPGQTGPCEFCPEKKLIDDQGKPTKIYSWDYQRPFDGSWFRVFSAAFRWVDGRLAHLVSSADITETKRNEALVHYMANYDLLTKLPNRRMLVGECEKRISQAKPGERGYVLFFDIDGFKAVNDCFGHEAGDELLVKLGEFFSAIPMLKDAMYRNGGDEFVAILGGEIAEEHIRNLAGFMHQRFKKPWLLKAGKVYCNISIGVACYPEDGKTPEILLNMADQAMYFTKKNGGGSISFAREKK